VPVAANLRHAGYDRLNETLAAGVEVGLPY